MKTQHRRNVIAIDDDEINLSILSKCAKDAGFTVETFDTTLAGWQHLCDHPQEVDIVLLDKMMPDMSGLELLKKIKSDHNKQHLPVILQTGDAGISQMQEGLENGAYYYLTKPFHPEILTAILHSAASECDMREQLLKQISESQSNLINQMHEGNFHIRTHAEASQLAAALSQSALYPEFAAIGMMEILTNAIEHGNLEFGFEKKKKALWEKSWSTELTQRLNSADLGRRKVSVYFIRNPQGISITVKDQGKGFDWQRYLHNDSPGALADPNGRGISKAIVMLDNLEFIGDGSEVRCQIPMASLLN